MARDGVAVPDDIACCHCLSCFENCFDKRVLFLTSTTFPITISKLTTNFLLTDVSYELKF